MVQQGDFSVQLVEAHSKKPFKEFVDKRDNKVYAEVEPNEEYFVQIQRTGMSTPGVAYVTTFVDGNFLGYYECFGSHRTASHNGLWTRLDGVGSMRALKFVRPSRTSTNGFSKDNARVLSGKVEVKIYQGIYAGVRTFGNFSSTLPVADVAPPASVKSKTVRSGKGKFETEGQRQYACDHYTQGPLVDTITLGYCTTLGLVTLGILEKPDCPYKMHVMLNPKRALDRQSLAPIPTPKKIRIKNSALKLDLEYELFDLCND